MTHVYIHSTLLAVPPDSRPHFLNQKFEIPSFKSGNRWSLFRVISPLASCWAGRGRFQCQEGPSIVVRGLTKSRHRGFPNEKKENGRLPKQTTTTLPRSENSYPQCIVKARNEYKQLAWWEYTLLPSWHVFWFPFLGMALRNKLFGSGCKQYITMHVNIPV